jgi:hypothetical protein
MTTLVTAVISQPPDPRLSAKALAGAICPYLANVGCPDAQLLSVREYLEYRGGSEQGHSTFAEISLAEPLAEIPTVLGKLEGFLKRTAKDAGAVARFEFLVLIEPGSG